MGAARIGLAQLGLLIALTAWPASGQAIEVHDANGRECSVPRPSGMFRIQGGCRLQTADARIDVRVRTPLGMFRFGRCQTRLTLRVGPGGSSWIEQFGSVKDLVWPCSDLRACPPASYFTPGEPNQPFVILEQHSEPWQGRLRRTPDGRLVNRFQMCMDSCLGRFEGVAELKLEREARGGWRVVADDAGVGTGGLLLDGSWDIVDGDGIAVRGLRDPARRAGPTNKP